MTTPVRIIKLPCNEAGPFTTAKSMNFDIPSDLGVVDLDKSYVLFKMSATTTHTEARHDDAVRPVAIAAGQANRPAYESDCLVQNSYLHSERAGRLEDLNDGNYLNHALHFYGQSEAERQAATVYNGAFQYDEYKKAHSAFRDIRYLAEDCVNAVTSSVSNLTPEIRVPLKSVCKVADGMSQFPLFAVGDCRLHLETVQSGIKVMHAYEYDGPSYEYNLYPIDLSAADTCANMINHYVDPAACPLWPGAPVTIRYSHETAGGSLTVAADSAQIDWQVDDPNFSVATLSTTVSGSEFEDADFYPMDSSADLKAVVLDLNFTNPDKDGNNPYGQTKLLVDVCSGSANLKPGYRMATNVGNYKFTFTVLDTDAASTGPVTHHTKIKSLHWSNTSTAEGNVRVVFDDAFPVVASAMTNDASIEIVDPAADPTWEISDANLVLHQLLLSPDQMAAMEKNVNAGVDIPYMVWDTERANVNANETKYNRQFMLPPMCGNVLMIKAGAANLINETDTMTNYRYQLNGTQTTDREVEVREPLYHDRIIECWANMNKDLKNLDEEYTQNSHEVVFTEKPMISCQPVPLSAQNTILDYQVEATGMSAAPLRCYKQKQRTLKLSGQKAVIEN